MKSKIILSDSLKNFISSSRYSNKVSRYLQTAIWNIKYDNNIGNLMLTDSEVNYLTFRNDGKISYLPAGKKHQVNADGTWKRDGRQEGKAAKVIKKIINKKALKFFKDSDFEGFANSYKSEFSSDGLKLELWSNTRIKEAYSIDRIEGDGSLQHSCMNDDTNYLDIYHHCKQLQILVLLNSEGLLCGRSLVWSIGNDITLADRIYVTHDWQYDLFLNYISENKLWRKKHYKTYDYKNVFINPLGEEVNKHFTVYTDTDFDYYPYIDTFSYGDDGYLSNKDEGIYTYDDIGGDRSGNHEEDHFGEIYDDINDEWISEDDAIQIDRGQYRGQWTRSDNTITTYEGYVFWGQSSGFTYVERDSEYYLDENTVYCEYDDEDVLRDEAIEINDKWYHTESDLIVSIDGTYYTKDDDALIEYDDNYYLKTGSEVIEYKGDFYCVHSDEVIEIDGDYYHEDDEAIIEIDGVYHLRQLKLQFFTELQVVIPSSDDAYKIKAKARIIEIDTILEGVLNCSTGHHWFEVFGKESTASEIGCYELYAIDQIVIL